MKDTITHHSRTYTITIEPDQDHGAPWEECDGHGPVSDWTTRDKRPGELILTHDRHSKRYYDLEAATAIALRDGWNTARPPAPAGETKRQQAARAARADYAWLRAWCRDEWSYVGVVVAWQEDPHRSASLWGVESNEPAYIETVARELAEELSHELDREESEILGCVACKGTGHLPAEPERRISRG